MVTALAGLVVLVALIFPNDLDQLTPAAFLRLPLEGLVAVAVFLALPRRLDRARTALAVIAGLALGLLSLVKVLDMGFLSVLVRPFDPVLDWPFLANAMEFLTTSIGRAGAIATVIAIGVAALAVVVLITLSVVRLSRVAARHRRPVAAAVAVAGLAWITLAAFGAHLMDGVPVASRSAATLTYDTARQVNASRHDRAQFAKEAAVDPFRDAPPAHLLTGLKGKDVILAFVESYGRSAVEDPALAPGVDQILDDGTRRLAAAGYQARSAYLTSPTAGGGSWLAHSTLLSGLWVDNQQRYRTLMASDRLTLTGAFARASWRTVAVVPGTTRAWPEGAFYDYEKIYAESDLGYRGPHFAWSPMPDQYTLAQFQRTERAQAHPPLMAELALVSSHAPWAPIPQLVDWNALGDGSIFDPMPAAGPKPGEVWRDPAKVRAEYGRSIQYSLTSLIQYVEKYGGQNLVLVFLGDHQPAAIVTGEGAGRDVPITIVARDPAVLERISGWGWQDGLKPAPDSPVWPMSSLRDRFLTAFAH